MSTFFSFIKRLPLTRVIIGCILLLLAGAILRRCDRNKIKEITSEELRPGEKAAIIFGPNSGSVVSITNGAARRDRKRSTLLRGRDTQPEENSGKDIERIDGARGIRISVGDSGNISIIARTKGFCFEPGLGAYTTTSNRRIFVDTQLLFARRHGINAGIGLGLQRPINGVAFIAYSYNFWSNTSVLIGLDTKSEVLLGVRVKF